MLTDFEWCMKVYKNGWGTKEQLRIWVKANKLTAEEFKIITGEDY